MSLPDTVFIFVLALIIFGPKKLPEIGRQLGRLVGEFRRASNEFKYQIEEELRQADFNDQRNSHKTIAQPIQDTAQIENGSTDPTFPQDSENPAENVAIGQHPNIDTLDASALDSSTMEPLNHPDNNPETTNLEASGEKTIAEMQAQPDLDSVPTITPAANVQARTKAPYAPVDSASESLSLPFPQPATGEDLSAPKIPVQANSQAVPNEAEITHG